MPEAVFPAAAQGTEFPTPTEGDVFLDIGSHVSKPNLGYGWGRAERSGPRNFRWVWQLEADLGIEVARPGPAEIWIDAAPLYLGYRRQTVALYVNRRFVHEWVFAPGPQFQTYHAAIPAGVLEEGENVLTLRMGYRKRGGDDRELSLAVDRVLLRVTE